MKFVSEVLSGLALFIAVVALAISMVPPLMYFARWWFALWGFR